ncbi:MULTISPECIES: TetR/AcrR family transcriptional regulator [Rhodomicrobium]|uniref:TetR/AcrR family transcriptional regulator n=1 Tax=Rhodomicrobium TaxID=1068 RepID=UPI000B4B4EFE|nr:MULTISPECIES: TetR/AcrR family transcriptional regulator [Rhodomicrobium]
MEMFEPERHVDRETKRRRSPRLPKAARRLQLMHTARLIVREEGADRLTLGYLAARAGVSKPVVYDHFATRSILLIDLYRWLDTEQIDAFRDAMASGQRSLKETVECLAEAYIHCAADTKGEVHAIGAALAGSEEKAAVLAELLEHCVQMFASVLKPHSTMPPAELQRVCVGLVGAGEALAAALVRGDGGKAEAVEAFTWLIYGGLRVSRR